MQPFLKMWMPFLTQDINVHFRILFIAKFELFKLHSKVRSFERMFEFNQLRLGLSIYYIITIPMTEVFVGTDNATATKVLCESFHSFSSLGY